jgi:hypothetical protein
MASLGTRVPQWTVALGSGMSMVFRWGDTSADGADLLTSEGVPHQFYRFSTNPPSINCEFGQLQALETPEVDTVVLFTKKELVPPWRSYCVLAYRTYDRSLIPFERGGPLSLIHSAYSFRADSDNHTIDLVGDGQTVLMTFHFI